MTTSRRWSSKAISSAEMAVGDEELNAIIRLLGGALDDILSGTGGE